MKKTANAERLILILGDQLSLNTSALRDADPATDVVVMIEAVSETTYVPHHKHKLLLVLSAMRHFAQELRSAGWQVRYVALDDERIGPAADFSTALQQLIETEFRAARCIQVTEPGEWRLRESFDALRSTLAAELVILPDDRFLCAHDEFAEWAQGRKQLRMEYFYRQMRRKTGLLMDGDKPEGGKWNYDADNRKPAKPDLFMPALPRFDCDKITQQVALMVEERFSDHMGSTENFAYAVTQADANQALDHFIDVALASFGDYQDAMLTGEPFLYHSVLSPYINLGLLDPLVVCERVAQAYASGNIPLNAAEGFIRQIIGWREYVRGIYWLRMPAYLEENFFEVSRELPDFYWTGETDMACLQSAIGQTIEFGYAHHIQRLMITGNFALLIGVDPQQVHEWYLQVYVDAYEWVELPNTLGMSQFADGGLLGSKPYIAGGNYINRMSNYCSSCRYNVKEKTGEDACPFNALYWNFLERNKDRLKGNARMRQMYSTWGRMTEESRQRYVSSAERFLEKLA